MNLVNGCRLQYFKASEFVRAAVKGGQLIHWGNEMERRLLVMLDVLRSSWGKPIHISNGDGTVGRLSGSSRHSLPQWSQVMAVDIVPDGIFNRQDAERFYYLAKQLGFGGIGCYPQWNQGVGFHVDTRECEPYRPSCWGYVNGRYCTLHEAFEHLGSHPRIQPKP